MKCSAFTLDAGTLNPDTPSHGLYKRPAKIEAQTIARNIGSQIAGKADEPFKEQGNLFRRDTMSIISYCDLDHK